MIKNQKLPLKPPFRLGVKQKRAVLDSEGRELVIFPKGREDFAEKFVEFLNYEEGSCGKPIKTFYKKGFWERYDIKKFLRNLTKLFE